MSALPSGRHWVPDPGRLLSRSERINRLLEGQTTPPPATWFLGNAALATPQVALIQGRTAHDRRWQSMGLSTGALYLGAGLAEAGIPFTICEPALPATPPEYPSRQHTVWGITLFEDLFEEVAGWLEGAPPEVLVALGGPAATLHPLAIFTHLKRTDLLLRGEGEHLFPLILKALGGGVVGDLDPVSGLLLNLPSGLLCLDLDRPHRPDPIRLPASPDFPFPMERLREGLELNVSRGCRRACAFCAKVQGPQYRRLDLGDLDRFLGQHAGKLSRTTWSGEPQARSVNLNDDDLLQDPLYAEEVLRLLRKHHLGIWGLQTSPLSLLRAGRPWEDLLDLLADPAWYLNGKPLLWLGTDIFLRARARRLHKGLPDDRGLLALMQGLDQRGFSHHHYWILSDHGSTWPEFCKESLRLMALLHLFPGMGLLPHAPQIIPYPNSPLYQHLLEEDPSLLRYRKRYPGTDLTRLDLVAPVTPREEGLNQVLSEPLFRHALRDRQWQTVLLALYRGLQEHRLRGNLEAEGPALLAYVTHLLEEEEAAAWDHPLLRDESGDGGS